MRLFLRLLLHVLMIGLLTVFTQIGGLIYLLCLPILSWVGKKIEWNLGRRLVKIGLFGFLWTFLVVVVVPPLAQMNGRVPLPMNHPHLKPLHYGTVFLQRHYVRPELAEMLIEQADQIAKQYPGSVMAYMDASHPFWNGYPLLPHISHNDGRKADIAFFFQRENEPVQRIAPTFIGYGGCVMPRRSDYDTAADCLAKGHWQYDLLRKIMPTTRPNLSLDENRTKYLLTRLAKDRRVGKVLLEPHLEQRLGLTAFGKIRFHGCHAVRHDDHLHVQL
ncbi:MAG: hypothetical protein AAF206_12545 [Bacteroidota bacterium]